MSADQIRAIVEQAVRNSDNQEWWFATLLTITLVTLAAASAYYGAFLRQSGQNLATKQDIQQITKLAKEIEQQIKSRSEFLDKILLERYSLIRDLNKRLEFVRYNYERLRNKRPHELRIQNGETLDITEIIQMLELNYALLGDEFYRPLRQKYDQVIILYKEDLDWNQEMETWNRLSDQVQELMKDVFRFSEARLPAKI